MEKKRTVINLIILIAVIGIVIWGLSPLPKKLNIQNRIVDDLLIHPPTIFILITVGFILISKRKFSEFGFKTTHIKNFYKPCLVSLLIGFLTIIAGSICVMVFKPTDVQSHPAGDGSFLKMILSVWLLASAGEEIFYRGLLQTSLSGWKKYSLPFFKTRLTLPVIVSGILFGLSHFCLWDRMFNPMVVVIMISASVLGLMAGYYREKTDSLIPAYFIHLCFNISGSIIPMLLMKLSGKQ